MKKFLTIIIILSLSTSFAYSQASGTASVTATIVQPVSIPKSVDSEYGNVAVIIGGSVIMSPVREHSKPGNLSLPVTSGTFTIASFYTSGSAGYNYTITVPSEPLTIKNGLKWMKFNSFDSDPLLNSGPGLVAGVYVTVTPFNVTVNYN